MSTYGRGKFDAHPNYISYMLGIVVSDAFSDMPNAISNGKVNWQVSSGKNTSFYVYYVARWQWWVNKADFLGLPGKGNENERFTIAARLINPTGYKPCRLCGEDWNIGYFYMNARFLVKIQKICPDGEFFKWQPIDSVIHELNKFMNAEELNVLFSEIFPERIPFFQRLGVTKEAFEESNYINAKAWLTPGYMGNPPDRLDGFHDYHFECRQNHDPGRFILNMKSYAHDRRSFEYWAEGNWMLADTLYNLAGPGRCLDCPEDQDLTKVSPDHIGPISCGFKQMPFFKPLCSTHNSSKNRRFTYYDTKLLIEKEVTSGESVASFQVLEHWNNFKHKVNSDADSKLLSNSLRSLQDAYFRILVVLWKEGHVRFICTLLSPQHAFEDIAFQKLDASNLTFESYTITKKITPNRRSLFVRSIRIALASLQDYESKKADERKLLRKDFNNNQSEISNMLSGIELLPYTELDQIWASNLPFDKEIHDSDESIIHELTESEEVVQQIGDLEKFNLLYSCMSQIGLSAPLDL